MSFSAVGASHNRLFQHQVGQECGLQPGRGKEYQATVQYMMARNGGM